MKIEVLKKRLLVFKPFIKPFLVVFLIYVLAFLAVLRAGVSPWPQILGLAMLSVVDNIDRICVELK